VRKSIHGADRQNSPTPSYYRVFFLVACKSQVATSWSCDRACDLCVRISDAFPEIVCTGNRLTDETNLSEHRLRVGSMYALQHRLMTSRHFYIE